MDAREIEGILVGEIRLRPVQARVFLLVTTGGRMRAAEISSRLGITEEAALEACRDLVGLGGFIDMPRAEFEAMHPRFTAVNMYRKACERAGFEFARNRIVDGVGAALEGSYDDARAK